MKEGMKTCVICEQPGHRYGSTDPYHESVASACINSLKRRIAELEAELAKCRQDNALTWRTMSERLEAEKQSLRTQIKQAVARGLKAEAERDRLKEVLHAVTLCHDCPVCQHAAREALNKADTK